MIDVRISLFLPLTSPWVNWCSR